MENFDLQFDILLKYYRIHSYIYTIPEDLTLVKGGTFEGDSCLLFLRFPENSSVIPKEAFRGNACIVKVHIPPQITSIGDSAFEGCWKLAEITIPDTVRTIGREAFSFTRITNITIPKGITKIKDRTFLYCSHLKSVILPEGLKAIGASAFSECCSLTDITIPETVTQIGDDAFDGCENLTLRYGKYCLPPVIAQKFDYHALHMLKDKQLSAPVPTFVKAYLLSEIYLHAPQETEIIACIRKRFTKLFKTLIAMQFTSLAEKMIQSGQFLTQENIDELIQYAIKQKAYEIQLMLIHYKYQHFGDSRKELKL